MLPYTYTTNWGKDLVTNWEDFIEGLKEINYRGAINFETFRVPAAFPNEVKTELFKLIYAIGKYFATRIEG
jgi:sugar phosphate isomerase/epimerase